MTNETLAAPFTHPLGSFSPEILDKPIVIYHDEAALKVFAVNAMPISDGLRTPVGFVSTKTTRVLWLGEFSGKPTGEYSQCNAVKGFVGENAVYSKTVTTDTPLSGLRTFLAQRRAARTVKSRLKS